MAEGKKKTEENPCKYTSGVSCSEHKCETCAFNPDNEELRKKRIADVLKKKRLKKTAANVDMFVKDKSKAFTDMLIGQDLNENDITRFMNRFKGSVYPFETMKKHGETMNSADLAGKEMDLQFV